MPPTELEHQHTPEAIQARLDSTGEQSSYLRDFIYGGIDGAVTTFAIVSAVVGGELSARTVLILGVANLVADGFSMAAGNYTATKSEVEQHDRIREMEFKHIAVTPEGERDEIREIYRRKGFEGADLDRTVDLITRDPNVWVKTMLSEEFGLPAAVRSPLRAAFSTFLAFVLCGAIPLLPWFFRFDDPFPIAIVLTLTVFFLIGSARSAWSLSPWWKSGLQTLLIGAAAASVAYTIGRVLSGLAT